MYSKVSIEAINELSAANKVKMYEALAEYTVNNKIIKLKGVNKAIFMLIIAIEAETSQTSQETSQTSEQVRDITEELNETLLRLTKAEIILVELSKNSVEVSETEARLDKTDKNLSATIAEQVRFTEYVLKQLSVYKKLIVGEDSNDPDDVSAPKLKQKIVIPPELIPDKYKK